jgi:N-acetylmuramoyl-L-alanine amidase
MYISSQNIGVCCMRHDKSLLITVVFVFLACMCFSGAASAGARVLSVEAYSKAGEELIEIQFSEEVHKQKLFMLDNPDRVVLDVDKMDNSVVALPSNYEGALVRSLRFGQNSPQTSRFVIALNQAANSVTAHEFSAEDGKPYRIVVAMSVSDAELKKQHLSVAPRESSGSFFSLFSDGKREEGIQSQDTSSPLSVRVSENLPQGYKPSATVTFSDTPPKDAKKNTGDEVVRQDMMPVLVDESTKDKKTSSHPKASGKPLIVIDAGHGGKDPGASGQNGEQEKMITLAFAKQLASVINGSGRYRAKLTRDGDSFIMLGERVEIARRAGAALFISLHADSAPGSQAEGLSVYTVSETASDKESAKLAESENNADSIGGLDLGNQEKVVADILTDLARRETKNKSTDLAQSITRSMQRSNVRMLKDPHRFAGFRVLKAPDTPSVLIELGFISTPEEAAQLKSSAHRERITRAILGGVDGYFE